MLETDERICFSNPNRKSCRKGWGAPLQLTRLLGSVGVRPRCLRPASSDCVAGRRLVQPGLTGSVFLFPLTAHLLTSIFSPMIF